MIVYGRNPVREALRGPRTVEHVWATSRAASEPWLEGVEVRVAGAEEIEGLCGSPEHQGICAEAGPYRYADADSLLEPPDALVLCLDEVQDPHNLGAVCRVAEAAGCSGVVIPERRSATVTPATCKASAGAVEHLAVAQVRNLADWLATAKAAGAWVYGADSDAPVAYDAPGLRRPRGACAGLRGARPEAARELRLRRPGGAAAAGQGRVAQRGHRGGRAGVRGLAPPREDLTGLHNSHIFPLDQAEVEL